MRSKFQYLKLSLTVGMVAVLLASGHSALAQAIFGQIAGTVTDSTGAAIPNATVVVSGSFKQIPYLLKFRGPLVTARGAH